MLFARKVTSRCVEVY